MANKFWILEDPAGTKIGTLQVKKNKTVAFLNSREIYFDTVADACKELDIHEVSEDEDVEEEKVQDVMGFPVHAEPFNVLLDLTRNIPLFTKSKKSKSFYAAGYYIVKFDHGWIQSFCPKMTTLTNNEFKGPFKTKFEMKARLRLAIND